MTRSQPYRAESALLEAWTREYQVHGKPIQLDFRALASAPGLQTAIRPFHPYPGRLLSEIPRFFLRAFGTETPQVLLDPFCGSGTVPLEGVIAGWRTFGADSNPFARLLTRARTTAIDPVGVRAAFRRLVARLPKRAPRADGLLNPQLWFAPQTLRGLLRLRHAVEQTRTLAHRELFQVTLARCVTELSLADPRIPVPVRLRPERYTDPELRSIAERHLRVAQTAEPVAYFERRLHSAVAALSALRMLAPLTGGLNGIFDDARNIPAAACQPNLVITSPPYLTAQKYVRASSQPLTWLRLSAPDSLRRLEDQNIGREHFSKTAYSHAPLPQIDIEDQASVSILDATRELNPAREHQVRTYLAEMRVAFASVADCLQSGGHIVLIAADNYVCGSQFPTNRNLVASLRDLGLDPIVEINSPIRNRTLITRRRGDSPAIDSEHITVFRKSRRAR